MEVAMIEALRDREISPEGEMGRLEPSVDFGRLSRG